MDKKSLAAHHDQNAITALAQSSLVSMILVDDKGVIRFLNEPAKFALPHLKYGQSLFNFLHDAHHGRLETCLHYKNDFSPKLVQLQFKMLHHAMLWEVFHSSGTGEVVLLTQETGFANVHREQLIRQQEEIFQAMEDGFFEIDNSGTITSVNQTLKSWFPGEFPALPQLQDWFKQDEVNQDFFRKLQNLRHRYLSEEGLCFYFPTNRWCRFELVPRVGAIMVRLTDISEEITSDEALKLAQRRMTAILESTGDANLLIDDGGKLLSFNGKASEVIQNWLGFLPVEGMDFRTRLSLNQNLDFDTLIQKALNGEFVSFELKVNPVSGNENWFNVRIFPAKNEEGVVFGASFNLSDITHHKEAEHILTDTERKLLALFSATNESFVLFDSDAKVKFFNKRLLQLPPYIKAPGGVTLGCSLQELGLNFPEEILENILNKTLEGVSQKQIFEIQNSKQDANWWAINAFPALTSQGSLLGAVLAIEEVSEEFLSKQEILDRHNQLKELAQIHSHEVRKPLANVLGLLDIIANIDQKEEFDQEKVKSFLSGQISELDAIIQKLGKQRML